MNSPKHQIGEDLADELASQVALIGWSALHGNEEVDDDGAPLAAPSKVKAAKRQFEEDDESDWGVWQGAEAKPSTAAASKLPQKAAVVAAAGGKGGKGKGPLNSFQQAARAASLAARTAAEFARSAAEAFDAEADRLEEALAAAEELNL